MKRKWCDKKGDKVQIGSKMKKETCVGMSGPLSMYGIKVPYF